MTVGDGIAMAGLFMALAISLWAFAAVTIVRIKYGCDCQEDEDGHSS